MSGRAFDAVHDAQVEIGQVEALANMISAVSALYATEPQHVIPEEMFDVFGGLRIVADQISKSMREINRNVEMLWSESKGGQP